ncbi:MULTISPECIES: SDR family NAD(P)-dependent oxidoreductase [unclassified Sphingopyxis]|jgi:NAD(P)-dependent dehydrogenase (short-subunit alcohol dehydrogenase family)|uniref:SDR family NAD(P)-dependent oxidoreductase n=1 Tax=unclassified Sphingopyxis TaxID=2614943 RepID=UPI0025DF050E|nr:MULTISPECIES: SDR family oxidoreductase [unclassified Sphingopyxis]
MSFDFSGRTALVTGDDSGIGLAVADALRAAGATVIGIDRSRGDDVADPDMWLERADSLAAVDLAVVNAGISDASPIIDIDFMAWRRLLAVNLDGAMLSLQAAMRAMTAHGLGGAIVTTASISGIKAEPGTGAYGASKAALIQLTKVAAKEGAPHGIRVNAIAPGGVDTPIWDDMPFFTDLIASEGSRDAAMTAMAKMATPLGRYATADETAAQILFLLSDAAATITGSVLTSDGGYSL